MSDIESYRYQVSPELPKGPSPFQLIAGFNPPDTQVTEAVGRGLGELGNRIADLAIKISAADQNSEVARARANYFSKMKDWTANIDKSDIDPKEYRTEFDRQSNALAGEISKGFRYANSHDQFSTWRTEQDVPLLGETLQQQLKVMNDRFGASLMKGLEMLQTNPDYLPTFLRDLSEAETSGAKTHVQAEELRQVAFVTTEAAQIVQEGEKIGSAAMTQRLLDRTLFPHVSDAAREVAIGRIQFKENVKQQALDQEDEKLETHFANDVLLKAKTDADLLAGKQELMRKPFNNGDLTLKWLRLFTPADPADAKDWEKAPPDPVVYSQLAELKTAVRFGRRLPNNSAYGQYAGRIPSFAYAVEFVVGHQMQLGSTFRSEREAIDDLENTKYSATDQKLDDLFKSDTFKKRWGNDPVKSYQAQGDIRDHIHDFIDKRNPSDQELFAEMYAYTQPPIKSVTEDTATTDQGAALALRFWNRQLPNWTDGGQTQNQAESLALAQRTEIAKYFGRDPNALPRLPAKPAPGQEGYSIGANGWAAFIIKGNYYAFVPESYDKKKRVDDQTYKGNLKLKQFVGGAWVDLPEPKAKATESMGTVSGKQIAGMDRNTIKNKILALKTERAKQQQHLQEYKDIISGNVQGFDPMSAHDGLVTTEKVLKGIEQDLENLESALKERGAR